MSDKCTHILLIEDNPGDARLIQEYLVEARGFRADLEVVTTLSAGCERLMQPDIDLVLLDLSLPDSSGLDTLLQIQTTSPHKPIVVLTGLSDDDLGFEAVSKGAQDYLVKGQVDKDLLVRSARYAIERKRTEEVLRTTLAQTEILHRTSQSMIAFEDLPTLLQTIVDNVVETLCADRVTLITFDLEKRRTNHFVKGGKGSQCIIDVSCEELWNGLSGWVLREGQPALSPKTPPDPRESPEVQRRRLDTDCGAIIVVPLIYRSELLGTVTAINRPEERDFTQHDVELMSMLASQAAAALQNAQLFAAERDQRAFTEALSGTAAILTSTLDVDVVMKRILSSVGQVVPHDAADIMLIEGDSARVVAWVGYPASVDMAFQQGFTLSLKTETMQKMVKTGTPVVIPDIASYPEWVSVPETAWIRSYIGVPIQGHKQVIGFLNLDSATPGFFTRLHAERLQAFADQAAIALENAQLYHEIQCHAAELEQRVRERTAEINCAKERVETILNNSTDVIVLLNNEGIIQQANPTFSKLFHCEPGESAGQPLAILAAPESAAILMETLWNVVKQQRPQRLAIVARYKDCTAFDADVALSPIQQENGQLSGVVCSLRDITTLKQTETSLRRMLDKETELSELKSRFISTASHEFRTPLAIIQTASDLLEHYSERMSEERKQKEFRQIGTSIAYMVTLLDDILTMSRAEKGKLEFKPEPLDLAVFCESVMANFEKTDGKDHTFVFSYAGDSARRLMDSRLLHHVINNLLSNAVKYSPSGAMVTFNLICDNGQTVFRIRDEGIGIPLADQPRLFEPFHRARNVGTIHGNGLGLAIAKQAVDLHGGTITVESAEDAGTTFVVILPSLAADQDSTSEDQTHYQTE